MMRINRKTDYAVRVLLALAKQPPGTRLSAQEIQEQMLVTRPFLNRIIANLSRAELILTYPGPNGGLELARPAEEINLRQIWQAIEGPLVISECLVAPGECPLSTECPVRCRWARLQNLILLELESVKLEGLADDARRISTMKAFETSKRVAAQAG